MGIWAAAAITVAATAAGAAVSASSADKAAKREAAASKKASRKEKKAFERQEQAAAQLEAELAGIQAPQWNVGADIADAERITGYNEAQLEKLYPGARNQRELASMAITDYMKGIVPQDVQEQTMRMIAERGGAGFNIATAGRGTGVQGPQADLARSLGLTSLQLQQTGMGMSRDWQSLAGAFFIESPLQVGQARLGFEQAAADLQMQKATAMYNARAGLAGEQRQMAGRDYARDVSSIESRLAAQQAIGAGIQSTGQALGGAFMGYGMAQAGASQAGGAGAGAGTSGYGSMVSSADYAAGQRGTGIPGSLQNAYYGQLGKPTYYDAGLNRSVVYGTNTIG